MIPDKRKDLHSREQFQHARAAWSRLRDAVRQGDWPAADKALDDYEPWADCAFDELLRDPN